MNVRLIIAVLIGAANVEAATTIDVSTRVAVPSVKRFGINLGWANNYDSGQIMKNLVFRNPGFEGQISQSIVRVGTTPGSATGFVDENNLAHWPTGFWNGASYEVVVGAAKGRSGTISTSTAPNPSATGVGTQYQFADSGTAPGAGDYILLRKSAWAGRLRAGCRPPPAVERSPMRRLISRDPTASLTLPARDAVNAVRVTAGLSLQSWTDPSIVAGSTTIQTQHILELRSALTSAFTILRLPALSFANSIAAGSVVHAADVQEVRDAVR